MKTIVKNPVLEYLTKEQFEEINKHSHNYYGGYWDKVLSDFSESDNEAFSVSWKDCGYSKSGSLQSILKRAVKRSHKDYLVKLIGDKVYVVKP